MRTKREFYNEICNETKKACETLRDLSVQLKEEKEKSSSNKFARKYLEENVFPQINKLERQLKDARQVAKQKVRAICDEYIAELKAEDDLDPSKITDDIKLLQSGVRLTKRDVEAMLRRNENNHTMLQIIFRHCDEHEIDTGDHFFTGNTPVINDVQVIPYSADTALKYPDQDGVYNQLFGEGSPIYEAFCGDGE